MSTRSPLPQAVAWRAVARCAARSAALLVRRRVHLPRGNVGVTLRFADGTTARVYRETVVDPQPKDPCTLMVSFRLRWVRGPGHAAFRAESILNTVLFVGFRGFASKLWMAHDTHGTYRGIYEWDGPRDAEAYARALWRVLELVSAPGSIDYRVVPGVRRDEAIADPHRLEVLEPEQKGAWWRVLGAA
ncbi:MAG TPA: hypothetical protein VFJ09_15210 [Nocardioidaceae bacterium]|nr:hypothetical protein [Nocardioidaceae bacterium]